MGAAALFNCLVLLQDVSFKTKTTRKDEERVVKLSETNLPSCKVSIGIKSFSHELGPRGGVQTSTPRPHSYNDLKVLLVPRFCYTVGETSQGRVLFSKIKRRNLI